MRSARSCVCEKSLSKFYAKGVQKSGECADNHVRDQNPAAGAVGCKSQRRREPQRCVRNADARPPPPTEPPTPLALPEHYNSTLVVSPTDVNKQ